MIGIVGEGIGSSIDQCGMLVESLMEWRQQQWEAGSQRNNASSHRGVGKGNIAATLVVERRTTQKFRAIACEIMFRAYRR